MRRNDVRSARTHLETILQSDCSPVPGLRVYSLYKLAECNFRLANYEQAGNDYTTFLSLMKDDTYHATANFRIGICYEMKGLREQALPFYREAISSEHNHGDDRYSSRKARTFLNKPITTADSLLLSAKNAFKSGKYEAAIALYKRLDTTWGISPTLKAEVQFGIGEVLTEQEHYAEALPYLKSPTPATAGSELWLIPWSHYQLGICHANLGNTSVARREFEQALATEEEYDFRNWLVFRTERELERLQQ